MSEQTKTLEPKLRFPEFKDADEWEAKPLSDLYDFKSTNSYSRDMLNYDKGSVKNIHYGDIHTKFSTLFDIQNEKVPFINASESLDKIKAESYCVEGDIIFADASEDLADIGKSIEIVCLNNERLISGLHTILARQKNSELVLGFGGHLFKSSSIRKQIQKESQGSKVLGISGGRLSSIKICYPSDKEEQQKIAYCLSSIDELITAQTQKITALKDHKKGLMQQLFPVEGETIPKLRFPEFQDARDWEEKTLDECLDYQQPTPYLVSDTNYSDAFKTPVLTAGKTFILGYTNEQNGIFSDNLPVIIFDDFTTATQFVDFPFKAKSSAMKILLAKPRVNIKFMYELMQIISYEVGTHERHWISKFAPMATLVPQPKEQQKIADCLSSIDELITAQTQKLEAYKTHKKGLMQQLFPAADEVSE